MSLIFLPCVAGPLANEYGAMWNGADHGAFVLSNANLTGTQTSGSGTMRATTSHVTTGKYYFECHCDSQGGTYPTVGVTNAGITAIGIAIPGSWGISTNASFCFGNGSYKASGVNYAAGDVFQIALDLAANSIWYGKNGTWILSGNPSTGANPTWTNLSGAVFPAVYAVSGTIGVTARFRSAAFTYAAPTGFAPW